MMKSSFSSRALAAVLLLFVSAGGALAQTRSWVSGTGDDAAPCSRTAPCKTLAGAYSKTNAGGEISIIDAAALGALTITKAITINGEGVLGSVLVSSGAGITVAAGASDQVILRNLSITGAGGGNSGIVLNSGHLTVDKCFIYGFTAGFIGGVAINANTSASATLEIRNTDISNSTYGVLAGTSSGFLTIWMDGVNINNTAGYGVAATTINTFIEINHSSIRGAGVAGVATTGTNAVISVDNSTITNNAIAVDATSSGSVIRINANSIYDNPIGFSITAGATIATANNNKTAGNGGSTVPNGSIGNQ